MDTDCVDIDMLVNQTSNLHCFDEALELVLRENAEESATQVAAVGKILSQKPHSGSFVRATWPKYGDKRRVLDRSPWSILKDVPPSTSLREVDFSSTYFWVRFTGLPRDAISEDNVRLITSNIGRLISTDRRSLGVFFLGDYVRARVEIPMARPLAAGFFQKRKRGSPRWIQFKYERLQDFCFKCGLLGHDYRICRASEGATVSNGNTRVALYGPWLRAENDTISYFQTSRNLTENSREIAPVRHTGEGIARGSLTRTGTPALLAATPTSSVKRSEQALTLYRSYLPTEEIHETDIQMLGTDQKDVSLVCSRRKRKGDEKYSGEFPDILIDHCYYPEEYFNDIIDYGSKRPPSRKRKAQEFILPIAHLSDMPKWAPRLNLVQLAQQVQAISANEGQSFSVSFEGSSSSAIDTPLQIEPSPFTRGKEPLSAPPTSKRRWMQRARAKGRVVGDLTIQLELASNLEIEDENNLVFRCGAMETGPKVSPRAP
ncbi:Zinc knuckle CX2CX4HX4C [Trema orientale]|uniref:Zinc knuckle CX2CX4HX4C n=1 Tax=Trema orientale TaxID=63057 RepID=A0A2P5FH91_TREOI|nr:Zinc knuckle CX2CX4HX4C [Trema orientale]